MYLSDLPSHFTLEEHEVGREREGCAGSHASEHQSRGTPDSPSAPLSLVWQQFSIYKIILSLSFPLRKMGLSRILPHKALVEIKQVNICQTLSTGPGHEVSAG